jgi:hypothetical protein
MKPPASIDRQLAMAAAALMVVNPNHIRIKTPVLGPAKSTFQFRTQSVLDYMTETLRKAW